MKILNRPIQEWPQAINSTRGSVVGSLQEVNTELHNLLQRTVLLNAYIGARYTSGMNDRGHEESAKRANQCLVDVRVALGHTYPENLPFSIQ